MAERHRGLSLGTRIFMVTGLLLVLALGVAIFVTSYLGNRIGLATATERILASNSVQSVSQQERYQQLSLLTQILTADPELKAYLLRAIDEHDQLSLLDQLDERQADLGYDFALMVDPQGRLLVRTDQPDAPPADLSERPLVKKVLVDFEASGVWQEGNKIYEAVAVPLTLSQNVFAYLVVGFAINDVRALEVKRVTGTEVAYLAGTSAGVAVVASTLAPAQQDRLLAALRMRGDLLSRVTERGQAADQVEIALEGGRWLALLAPLKDATGASAGASVALASLDKELVGYTRIRNILLGLGLATIVAALIISYLVSRRVFKPVRQLVAAATAARSGNYDVPMPTGGPGEVADLATAFNTLLIDLRERRDMAAYVSALSRSLPEPMARGEVPSKAERARLTLVGVDLRRFASPRQSADPEALMQRLSRDLKRILNAVEAHGGHLEAVFGHRAIASFSGGMQSDRALAAGAEMLAAIAKGEHALDEAQPPAIAISSGEAVTGAVNFTDNPERTVIGLPLQQVEGLLREAAAGDILLSPTVHAEVQAGLAGAGIELSPQRGLLSTQAIYILAGDDATRVASRSISAAPTAMTDLAAGGSGTSFDTLSDVGPGTLLGSRFEILSTLGAGGMGVVFKARDRELDDLVALKMLKREVAGDAVLVERLKSELKLARKITHPNILRTFDFGEIDGNPFISMEYVRGLTLRAMLERSGRLPYSAGLRLARQLTSGLAAAHALAIIHRDIKPENIILDSQGNAKLMDFGLARPVTRLTPGQTQAGFIVGTPHYLAPEQLEGKEPDQRADVYACGVVLFEVFTGRLPFGGNNLMEILSQHLRAAPVAPHEFWPEIPPALEHLLLRCLEKDPAARYADAAALVTELDKLTA
ncbi:MAG: protein kinase [Thermoanaerobaculia bacterium]